jgi:hypothetical protein
MQSGRSSIVPDFNSPQAIGKDWTGHGGNV